MCSNIESNFNTNGEKAVILCSFCFETIIINDRKTKTLDNCEHMFHKSCIKPWLKNKGNCPLCRTSVDIQTVLTPEPQIKLKDDPKNENHLRVLPSTLRQVISVNVKTKDGSITPRKIVRPIWK